MANVLVEETSLENIADAIRSKNSSTDKYKPAQMADAISAISGGGITPTGTKTISITQNGTTTEDVTSYASAQVNANVPNSYTASDEGKVVDSGALVAQTSKSISANGTYDTTTNDEVVVNVPTGITPSGSQTFTENGTYDVTNIAEAVVNVASSGGGVHTEEGYVEFTDTRVQALTIPVDLTSATGFILNLYAVGTGEVSGGAVTEYDHIEIPTVFASNSFVWNYMLKYPQNPAPVVYRDSTNLSSLSVCYNTSYTHAKRGSNGAQIGIACTPTISASGLTITTMNGGRLFCMAGAYAKFKYEVTWW